MASDEINFPYKNY